VAFAAVGGLALLVHFATVAALVPFGVSPLLANVFGFLAALTVSFAGHSRWSFPAPERDIAVAASRFVAVAVAGFALNEATYAVLLSRTTLDYRVASIVVLAGVAGLTWLASRHWAFGSA
jgi:putative flippase GtrA